jgi:hypothetical protein
MSHEHSTRALVELRQIGKTPSGANPILQHAPEAFDGIEVVASFPLAWDSCTLDGTSFPR